MPTKRKVLLMARRDRLLWLRRGEYVREWWFRRRDWTGWRVGPSRTWHDPGHAGPHSIQGREVLGVPKKPNMPDATGLKLQGASPGQWGKGFPLLSDWLCGASWDDGTPLGKTRLSLFRTGQEIVAALQIADLGGVRVEARAADPLSAVAELEQLLGLPAVPWQQDVYPIGQGGKKKTK